MRILVIAPHPDDETIGCGGTALLHIARNDRVEVVFLTSGELGLKHLPFEEARSTREAEAKAAAEVLGIELLTFLQLPDWGCVDAAERAAGLLAPILAQDHLGAIYVPHPEEDHPDHSAAAPILTAAVRAAGIPPPWVLGYEVWTPLARYDHIEDITAVMDRKLAALRCYQSQLASFRYDTAIIGLNQYRGELAAKCRYAEVFRTVDLG